MARRKTENNKTLHVRSMSQFIETVAHCRDEWIEGATYFEPWFRGQINADWDLEPSIFRLDLLGDEDGLRGEFERRAPQHMTESPPKDYWGWYFLMQHYGAPTRLLDWTDSALVALFFALNSDSWFPEDAHDAAVWMLDPWWLNRTVIDIDSTMLPDLEGAQRYLSDTYQALDRYGETNISPRLPISIDPPYIARRVAVQRSHFTIFGYERTGLMELWKKQDARLLKIVIAKEAAPRLRADLTTLGLTDTSIFPDLRGLAYEVTRYYLGTWPPDEYPD
jgi:hypothetical protein